MATQKEIEEIIAQTISDSDGVFYMAWADGYDELTPEEQARVDDAVYEEIYNCDCCGWHFHVDNLETVSNGESMCWQCATNFLMKKETKKMKIKLGYSMGYAGTYTEWTEEVPDIVKAEGEEAIAKYLEETRDDLYQQACDKISVWAYIKE